MTTSHLSKYGWNVSKELGEWQRPLFAGENMWLFRPKEVREMFLGGVISLSTPLPQKSFIKAITKAWCLLRLRHPEIACLSGCDDFGNRYMRHQVPSTKELRNWTAKTILEETSGSTFPVLEARKRVLEQKYPEYGACLHILSEILEGKGDITAKIGVLFNMDHIYTDGIGIRILAGKFFQFLSIVLASENFDLGDLDLREGGDSLSVPYTSLMNGDQKFDGESYELALIRQRKFLLELVVG